MDLIIAAIALSVLSFALSVSLLVLNRDHASKIRVIDESRKMVGESITAISTRLGEIQTAEETLKRLASLESTIGQLQLDSETLKERVLRHLQMASQRLKKADEILDSDEPEDFTFDPSAPPEAADPTPQDNRRMTEEELSAYIRQQGGTPL